MNWETFSIDLHIVILSPNPILSNTEELDEAVDFLTVFVQECMVSTNRRTFQKQQKQFHPNRLQLEKKEKAVSGLAAVLRLTN